VQFVALGVELKQIDLRDLAVSTKPIKRSNLDLLHAAKIDISPWNVAGVK